MGGKTSTASRSKYNAKTYERLVLNLRIDSPQSKKAIEAAAEQAGESATAYVVEAVRRRMEQEQMLSVSDTPGVVKNLEPGVILAEGKSYLFSPVRDKIWWLFRENTLPQRKRHPTLKSDASFCLSRKVFPDEISSRLHLHETLRVGQNRYIRQMSKSNATWHYNPQC